jgi:cell division protein FtsQ
MFKIRHRRVDPAAEHVRRDPAPSRWGYRYQRLMLTPSFRAMVRIGLPVMLIVIIAGTWFAREANRDLVAEKIALIKSSIHDRPEFMVTAMAVDGADTGLATQIRAALPLDFPVSSFDLDLAAMRDAVEAVHAVQSATLRVAPGGILQVDVTPRVPIAIWRQDDGLRLIDAAGIFVAPLENRSDRLDLPLIAGDGARDALNEALALYAAAGPVAKRVRGLVRMGERRWDVVLDRDQRILLPADDPIPALERVIAMQQAQEILDRDVSVVDMRYADRPTVRLNEPAVAEMRRINASVSGAGH